MHIKLLIAQRNEIEKLENFFWQSHRDAASEKDLNEFGWFWIHFKEAREKLDVIIATVVV